MSPNSEQKTKSLVLRLILPIPVLLVIVMMAAWFIVPDMIMNNARQATTESAVQTANQFKTIRGYYTKNIISKALGTGALQPSINHRDLEEGIPLPATMIHDLSKLLEKNDTTMALYSAYPFPNRSERKLDDFSQAAWEYLSKNPEGVYSREEKRNGKTVMRVAIADLMAAQGCVDCHNGHPDTPKDDWKLGDVRGVLEIASSTESAVAAAGSMTNMLLIGMAFVGIMIVGLILFVARSIAKPIDRMTHAMSEMADGELSGTIPDQERKDEIGQMARALTFFQSGLREAEKEEAIKVQQRTERDRERQIVDEATASFTEEIEAIVSSVTEAAADLNSTAQSMASVAEQTSGQSNAVSAASEEAAANVQAVAAATDQITTSISGINGQVLEASSSAKQAVERVEQTSAQMQLLAANSEKIGEVVRMISDIADQTNLLALNATIESARAGEHGKGFAVVAAEVKGLASQTGKATDEIVAQIEEIQSGTRDAVASMEDVGKIIAQVEDISSSIAANMDEQGHATQEISGNVREAAAGSMEVTQHVTGISESSQEVGAASSRVLAASGNLSTQSNRLREEIEHYVAKVRAG